jgi:prepilin-type processing-associated H-X9-DG protein
VELLVVIVLIAVLIGLALPAVSGAREAGRRAACSANQARIAMAMARYHSVKNCLPNTLNQLPGASQNLSWIGVLLPHLGRTDAFNALCDSSGMTKHQRDNLYLLELPEAMCPSGRPRGQFDGSTQFLAYGANAGTSHTSQFKPHDGALVAAGSIAYDDISNRDGLANTWLIADATGHMVLQNSMQVNWHDWSSNTVSDAGLIRFLSGSVPSRVLNNWGATGDFDSATTPDVSTVPPRSRHAGGVVFAFCDGRTKFLSEDLSAHVYAHLTTSHSVWEGAAYGATNSGWVRSWLAHNPDAETRQEPVRIVDGVHY